MRLFIAIELPEQIKEKLALLQKEIGDDSARISWVSTQNMHLTLKFLGEIPEERIEGIKKALAEIKFKPFAAELSGWGIFPSEKYIRVVWIGVEPAKEIIALQQKIESVLKEFPKDERFHPHLTIGRVKAVKDKQALITKIKQLKPEKEQFIVEQFKLIKSTLTKKGPIYETLSVFSAR